MRSFLLITASLLLVIQRPGWGPDVPGRAAPPLGPYPRLSDTALRFEANVGQTDREVQFLARGNGYLAFLTGDELVLRPAAARTPVKVKFAGATGEEPLTGRHQLAGVSNYFIGNDPDRWHTDIPAFSRVERDELYPGIALGYSARGRDLELDWEVAPGADPGRIRLEFEGVDSVQVNDAGALVLTQGDVELQFRKPTLFQQNRQGRREVAGRYRAEDAATVSFEIGEYDPTQALVIDPILSYSSFFGGSSMDFAHDVAVDGLGGVYIAGQTFSTDFPGADLTETESFVAYVAKLNASGTFLEYVTFIGGTDPVEIDSILFNMMGVAVDAEGFVYLTGDTSVSDFPTANALQPESGGGIDAFVVKLAPGGSSLVYSTYLGGSLLDWGRRLAIDASGNVVIVGITASPDFPTSSALQPELHGPSDAFVAKLDSSGSALVYSTFLGGREANDFGYGVALDPAGNAYVCGFTSSGDFPVQNAVQASNSGGNHEAFVSKIAADGSALVYSTYLGGTGEEECLGISVDRFGAAFVTGWTTSPDFPMFGNALGPTGSYDAFVTRLSPNGDGFLYSTRLGGSLDEYALDIVVNERGEAHLIGVTNSPDFPLVAPLQSGLGGGDNDAFVAVLSADASLLSSTYFGGSENENFLFTAMGIALSKWGDVIIAGSTSSWDLPRVEPMPYEYRGWLDSFVARISYGPQVELRADPTGNSRVLVLHLGNGAAESRTVELQINVVFVGQLLWPLYPAGTVGTLEPHQRGMVTSIEFPDWLLAEITEVQAVLQDPSTGAVLSESLCTAYQTPVWTCSR